jgi:hypothetical protein
LRLEPVRNAFHTPEEPHPEVRRGRAEDMREQVAQDTLLVPATSYETGTKQWDEITYSVSLFLSASSLPRWSR